MPALLILVMIIACAYLYIWVKDGISFITEIISNAIHSIFRKR